jgi:alkylation response protein AidB-like acyl-CoA dehydrogenase
MTAPGITCQPIEQITGGSDFSQVTFDGVRIPRADVVGEIGSGWAVAMTLLAAERLSGRHRYGLFRREAARLAHAPGRHTAREVGRLVAELEGMNALGRRIASVQAAGGDIATLASVNKLWWPATHQRLAETGLQSAEDPDSWYRQWLAARPESIYGGTAQIQRNILAERVLGLPR